MMTKQDSAIRRAREAAGLSQVQVAVRTKLSISTVRNAEYGLYTTRTLAAIAKVVGVEVHVLRQQMEHPVAA